ncbi:hypothetical protein [Novosphingobium taihuense]|uniref:Uncharacterized protein n=1 Tax=Novosphingobium taihuense TaxID=260085 RepID=A0A7W7AD28_9SPHN|nr:hypothetical protein [Novosphingobium taihuense]MBB4614681.1 hypothetical protein [Novosphingobium taihuense]TWH86077.1 hypothetical protein IQ25_01524 [Novosphingobium taihuense]
MSLSESDLFLDFSAVPVADAIVRKVAEYGHAIAFPAGFETTDKAHSGWVPALLNGVDTGFDYGVMSREQYLGNDLEAPDYPEHGNIVLAFAARGHQSSILAMSLVQRAICELTDAQGWWQEGEERLGNADMIKFCIETIKAIEANPAPAEPRRKPSRASAEDKRFAIKTLIIFGAVLLGIYVLSALAGQLFAPRTAQ